MSALTGMSGIALDRADIRIQESFVAPWPYKLVYGDTVILLSTEAANGLYADLAAELAIDAAEDREASRIPTVDPVPAEDVEP